MNGIVEDRQAGSFPQAAVMADAVCDATEPKVKGLPNARRKS